ncbi:hypothetical protein [Brevibacterium aurantiacum]|uniref:hypothetical protein n=1 Tax=Brevibacterium aurantiacum TaxID=273384 RepID=UPI001865F35F|nr:hypothetical protein [Brevibacterium aurantiacum]
MTEPSNRFHPFGRTRDQDLQILATGGETGWWDDRGRPAPWPEDFLDPEAGWQAPSPTAGDWVCPPDDPDNPTF